MSPAVVNGEPTRLDGRIFFPVVVMFNSIPVVTKAPILVLIMGNGVSPKIAIAALVCFFPTLVNSVRGLEAVNPQALELMRVLSASRSEVRTPRSLVKKLVPR